jgi:hypothetical protein
MMVNPRKIHQQRKPNLQQHQKKKREKMVKKEKDLKRPLKHQLRSHWKVILTMISQRSKLNRRSLNI